MFKLILQRPPSAKLSDYLGWIQLGLGKVPFLVRFFCPVSFFFLHLSNMISFWCVFFTEISPWPLILKRDPAESIPDNQVIVPGVAVVIISLHVKTKERGHVALLHKHKIEPRHVYIRLEMLSNAYPSVVYKKNQSKWTFSTKKSEDGRCNVCSCSFCWK